MGTEGFFGKLQYIKCYRFVSLNYRIPQVGPKLSDEGVREIGTANKLEVVAT